MKHAGLVLSIGACLVSYTYATDGGDCLDKKGLKQSLAIIESDCCLLPNGEPLDCTTGPPIQCTATCAHTFVPFWENCKTHAGSLGGTKTATDFNAFDHQCSSTHYNDEGTGDTGKSVLDPDSVCKINKEYTFEWIEISPLQQDNCIGATPAEQSACGTPPPRTGITKADIGTHIGDKMWTSGGQNTWASDDGWYDVDLPWDFRWYGRNENTITIGTNGVLTFGTPQYMYGGSEPVPCHGTAACSDGSAQGIGMDGVIAVFWTDLQPGKKTNCPQTHQCAGGGDVYYQVNSDHMIIEFAKVQSWSWNNQYSLPDPGQTFEAKLYSTGALLFQYLDMYCAKCSTAWSTVSIGFEDQSGLRGQQLEYGDIPPDGTAYFVPSSCHSAGAGGGGH